MSQAPAILLSFNVYRDANSDMFGIDILLNNIIHYVIPNSPAYVAGLQKGDRIIAINGIEVHPSLDKKSCIVHYIKERVFIRVSVFRTLSSPPTEVMMTLLPCYTVQRNGECNKEVVLSSGFEGTPTLPSYSCANSSTECFI